MATLKRDLGKVSGYATIIGILVGAGIFRVTGEAGAIAGSAVPLAYLLFAPIVISTALAYSVFVSTPLGMRPGVPIYIFPEPSAIISLALSPCG